MITETQVQIRAAAFTESLVNPIDQLAVLDRQAKELAERIKALKDEVANTYGQGKFRGEQYGVSVSLYESNTVDYKSLLAELSVPAEKVAQYTKKNAVIRVSVTA
jgi:hypothetical protein